MTISSRSLAAYSIRNFRTTVTVTRGGGDPVWDEVVGDYVTPQTTVYAGACALTSDERAARVVQAGERPHSLRTHVLSVPYDVAFQVDDTVAVTDSPDPMAIGSEMRVVDVPKSQYVTVRKVVVEEVS